MVVGSDQTLRDGHLGLGLLCERYADRVAQAVVQQCADAHGGFDTTILAQPSLGDTEMQRVRIDAFLVHARDQQSIGLNHHLGVGCLHRKHDVVVVVLARDANELQRGLDHARRRIAVAVHDAVRQRAVVGADAHGDAA